MFEFSCHAFLLNWLFWCRFSLYFVFEGALMPPTPQSWWGKLGGLSASPSKNLPEVLLMAKKATGDLRGLIGLHLCIGTITLHFWFLTRNEWGGKVTRKGRTAGVNECTWHIARVCVWWYFLVRVRLQWKERPGTHKPHEGSPYLHN